MVIAASTESVLATPPPSTTSTAASAPTTAPTTTTTNAPAPAAPTPTPTAAKSTQNHSYTSPNIKFEDSEYRNNGWLVLFLLTLSLKILLAI